MKDLRTKKPKNWVEVRVKDLVDDLHAGVSVNSGDRPSKNGEMGVLKTSSLNNGRFVPEENKVIEDKKEKERAKRRPKAGTIIISRMNTPELVGEIGYVEEDYKNLFLPDRLWLAKFKDNAEINVRWLSYKLISPHVRHNIKSIANGTSGSMKNISQKSFLNLPVTLPPKDEQDRTVEIISVWDCAISTLDDLIKAKKKYKKGLMQQLLSGKKRFPEFEGEPWKKIKPQELFSKTQSGEWGSSPTEDDKHVYPIIRSTNFQNDGKLDLTKIKYRKIPERKVESLLLEPRDIIIEKSGGSKDQPVGRVVYFDISNRKMGYTNFMHKLKVKSKYDSRFVFYKLLQFYNDNKVLRYQQQTTGIINYQLKDFLKTASLSIPSEKEEQRKIAKTLNLIDKEINFLEKKKQSFKKQKRGLMQQLLTGKTRVKNIGEEVSYG